MEHEELISKKEVLEKTGISYGQLYRWKRKGLIPEGWFIRRSTFTGQETFFPREKILERIERIKDLKEGHPLDDLAELITRRVNAKLAVAFSKLRQLGWLDEELLEVCNLKKVDEGTLSLDETLYLGVLRRLKGAARGEEIALAKRTLEKALARNGIERVREEKLFLYLLRKRLSAAGISAEISLVVLAGEGALFDPEIEVVEAVDLGTVLERIKLDLAKEEE
jgi:DNA-binding transcriptional MerR regulator